MKRTAAPIALSLAAAALVGCGATGGGSGDGGGGDADGGVVDGGTFTMAMNADPGNLDPQSSVSSALFSISQLPYDRLLNVDFDSGEVVSGLASEWAVDGTTISLTLAEGITCSDGAELTASDVAANLDHVADPKSKSPFLGTFLPVGAKTTADDAARTVTVELAEPAPFALQGLANVPIICAAGLEDRASLAEQSLGTGPYELTEAAPGDSYTYTIRDGYTWGPGGAATDTEGLPDTIVVKVVQNESTAANLLLSGQLNGAIVNGPDTKRLEAAGLTTYDTAAISGEQFYNQAEGRATSDPEVRLALTQALDLEELQGVLTSGAGSPATTLAALDPVACPGDSVSAALPAQDVDAATAALADADVPGLTFLFDPSSGSGVGAAAELAVQQWKAAGVTVTPKPQSGSAIQQTVFGTGDWDIAWLPLNVSSPDQLVPFLSGPGVAEGGTNFAAIDNPDYVAGVEEASAMVGQEGCDTWLEAESFLVAEADVVPFANTVGKTWQQGAEFEYPGQMVPTSIRMLAK
ncbi:ABC transporter substrate-binding protein [Nocardioides sp. zg-579]|uniref:ABC transporter substrate-binding protein n=1 Tax=Nocardioides marmotae TaxID=2663857 RepID=A0A6I3J8N5_9ACTN|nr:ABC transporter substrate-binding protein [Nocardioides marmotae]MCR6029890.1 ABC transporter substrate-binding protein [Gordonia jinghuaiqii]MTB93520.1 ABC transporter substrate-binding protein [Nocardioides marmotae]QKD99894.1 ABC transporter substrate-binding protein [Nocardioides marmotae]